jgi:hypothetical protein
MSLSDFELPRLLGTLSGLFFAVSLNPYVHTVRNLLGVKLTVYFAFSLAPFTFYLLTSSEKFVIHAAGIFLASLVNSLVILPIAMFFTRSRGTS